MYVWAVGFNIVQKLVDDICKASFATDRKRGRDLNFLI